MIRLPESNLSFSRYKLHASTNPGTITSYRSKWAEDGNLHAIEVSRSADGVCVCVIDLTSKR